MSNQKTKDVVVAEEVAVEQDTVQDSIDRNAKRNVTNPVNVVPSGQTDRARPIDGHTKAEEIKFAVIEPLYEIMDKAEIEHKKTLKTHYASINEIKRQNLAHAEDKDWVVMEEPIAPAIPACLTTEQQAIVDLYEQQVWTHYKDAGYSKHRQQSSSMN